MELVEKPTRVTGPNIKFSEVSRSGDTVFHVEDLSKRYGDRVLFENALLGIAEHAEEWLTSAESIGVVKTRSTPRPAAGVR